jgi:hypothetical protein
MSLSPEQLYLQLGSLVAEMPDLANGPITQDVNRWLGRAIALVEVTGDAVNASVIKVAAQNLTLLRDQNAQTIAAIVYQALAAAELRAPAQVQGTFIAAGDTLDAYAAVGKVLSTAKVDVLLIDPYASDEKLVTEYALLAPDTVTVRIIELPFRVAREKSPMEFSWEPDGSAMIWHNTEEENRAIAVKRASGSIMRLESHTMAKNRWIAPYPYKSMLPQNA